MEKTLAYCIRSPRGSLLVNTVRVHRMDAIMAMAGDSGSSPGEAWRRMELAGWGCELVQLLTVSEARAEPTEPPSPTEGEVVRE